MTEDLTKEKRRLMEKLHEDAEGMNEEELYMVC